MAAPQRNRIGELLIKARVIDELQLRSALARHDQWGGRLSRIIADLGIATEETIIAAICQGMGMQRMHLGNITRDPGALAKVDVSFAEQKGVFPVALKDNGKTLVLAMSDPTDLNTIDQVVAKSRARVTVVVAGDQEIEHAILRHYRGQEPSLTTRYNNGERKQRPSSSSSGEEDEFKVVDMSGNTVVKRIADIAPSQAAAAAAPAPAPAAGGSSAADILDEILAGGSPAGLTPEEMQRLQAVQQNQEKSSKILRALLELLLEKGALSQKELASRMRS